MTSKRILLTGLSTYWGGRLAQALERDPEVEAIIGVDRGPPKVELQRTEYVRVADSHTLIRRIVEAAEIDTVVDTRLVVDSIVTSPRLAHENNIMGTTNVLAACGGEGNPVRRPSMIQPVTAGPGSRVPEVVRNQVICSCGRAARLARARLVDLAACPFPMHKKSRARVSALDELIVGLDAAILVEDEDLQAGACHCAAVGGNHLPGELDNVAKTVCVISRLEAEFPGGDELLVGDGKGVGLLSGRTGRAPDSQPLDAGFDQARENDVAQVIELMRLAEKPGLAQRDLFDQR